ncbi:Plasma membrane t-SNARE, secretory vesicle fusion [Nowakowskiella sp. JEL0078]|nr:Plasma membrane t-SNARE, secretory vesicle fusion [Nowakowskiella sp. JEL0078]
MNSYSICLYCDLNTQQGGYHEQQEMQDYRSRPSRDDRYDDNHDYRQYGNSNSGNGYSYAENGQNSNDRNGDFWSQIETVNSDLDRVDQSVGEIGKLHTRLLNAVSRDETSRLQNDVDRTQDDCSRLLNRSRDTLTKLSAETKRLPPNDGETKIRKTKLARAAEKMMNIANGFQRVQENSKAKYRQRMERELRIAKPEATPQEIAMALDSNGGPIFSQQLLNSRVSNQKQSLKEVQDRHVELKKIEESIVELLKLFQEMQMLIETQDEIINTIEVQVDDTVKNVQEASTELKMAVEHKQSARKITRIIALVVTIVVLIILVWIFIQYILPIIRGTNGSSSTTSSGTSSTLGTLQTTAVSGATVTRATT